MEIKNITGYSFNVASESGNYSVEGNVRIDGGKLRSIESVKVTRKEDGISVAVFSYYAALSIRYSNGVEGEETAAVLTEANAFVEAVKAGVADGTLDPSKK